MIVHRTVTVIVPRTVTVPRIVPRTVTVIVPRTVTELNNALVACFHADTMQVEYNGGTEEAPADGAVDGLVQSGQSRLE